MYLYFNFTYLLATTKVVIETPRTGNIKVKFICKQSLINVKINLRDNVFSVSNCSKELKSIHESTHEMYNVFRILRYE